jgi:hypothetical protein
MIDLRDKIIEALARNISNDWLNASDGHPDIVGFGQAADAILPQILEEAARIVEHWSLPTIQTPSMWLVDKAGIASDIRALALSSHHQNTEAR